MMAITEKDLHRQICQYLRTFHPDILFNTDMSGVRLTKGQAIQAKVLRSCKGFPDIVIYEPSGKYHALFLEVKKESPYKKNGSLKSNEHIQEQSEIHRILRAKNYKCEFVWDYSDAIMLIRKYLQVDGSEMLPGDERLKKRG